MLGHSQSGKSPSGRALRQEIVRERGEILLDIDSTDDPTHGHQQFGFFNGA